MTTYTNTTRVVNSEEKLKNKTDDQMREDESERVREIINLGCLERKNQFAGYVELFSHYYYY